MNVTDEPSPQTRSESLCESLFARVIIVAIARVGALLKFVIGAMALWAYGPNACKTSCCHPAPASVLATSCSPWKECNTIFLAG